MYATRDDMVERYGQAEISQLERYLMGGESVDAAIADAEQAEKQANEDLDKTRVAFSTANGVNTTLINNIAQLETTLAHQLRPPVVLI